MKLGDGTPAFILLLFFRLFIFFSLPLRHDVPHYGPNYFYAAILRGYLFSGL